MRHSSYALACSLVLLAGCSHHDSGSSVSSSSSAASNVPPGWHPDALQKVLDADTGDKKPYTCTLDFAHAQYPQATAAVTLPGLITRVDNTHATVQASSPEVAEKAIQAGGWVYRVQDCETPVALRKVDTSFPADKYAALTLTPFTTLATYYAFTGGPVPYDQEAQLYDQAYRQTQDTFKKHDLLPAFQAKVDQAIATAKANGEHVRVSFSAQLGHYDFNNHTFTFGIPFDQNVSLTVQPPGGLGAQSDITITFVESPKFNSVKVDDEAKARQIEEAVNKAGSTVGLDVDAQVVGSQVKGGNRRILILAPIALHTSSDNLTGPNAPLFDIQ